MTGPSSVPPALEKASGDSKTTDDSWQSNQEDASHSEFQRTFLEHRILLRQILREFVKFMGNLPVKEDGINYFFDTIESLSSKTLFLEEKIGFEKTRKLFHRISLI